MPDTNCPADDTQNGVIEIFVTEVHDENVAAYHEWLKKIASAEAQFPGFQRMHVQPPSHETKGSWVTLLQFDTQENLDRWLQSPERKALLSEAEKLIHTLRSHRVISPFTGWFGSQAQDMPAWKQTSLVLLTLFPIVMLELKYLNPWVTGLNSALATFISNTVSVTLIAWPMMPIALYFLGWWIHPDQKKNKKVTFLGIFVILALYMLEIALFW